MASNYDGNKGVNGNGLLYFIGKVKTWIDTYFLKKNLGSSKASKVVVTDSSGNVDVSTITSTELGYLSGINQNIHTALVNKANQTDLTDLGDAVQTEFTQIWDEFDTCQKKIKVGGATSGNVTTISAGTNTSITISADGKTATLASTDTKMSNKPYTAGTDTQVVVGTKITGNNTLADTQKTLTAGAGISITGATDKITIANTYSYTLPQATDSTLGGVKVADVVTGSNQQGLNYVVKIASGGSDDGKLGIETASTLHAGVMSPAMVTKLAGIETGANKFTLQPMDFQVFGGAYLGTGLWMDDDHLSVKVKDGGNLAVVYDSESGLSDLVIVSSPAFTGTPTAPTAATSTNTTQIATTAFVHAAIENADIGGKTYQGNIDAENSATGKRALKDIKTFKQGQYFTVSSAFTFADGSWALGIGDMLFVKENYTWASGNVDGSKFAAVQGNNDYLTNAELDAIFTEVFGSAA